MSIWDDPDMKVNNDYVTFDKVGDSVTGRVLSVSAHRFDDGKTAPKLLLDVGGEERTLTAGQVKLKAELGEQRPEVGDILSVTLSDIEKRAGGKTLKHFTVSVTRGDAAAPAAPTAAAPAAAPTPATAPAAAPELDLASLPADKQEQAKAALAALGF